MHFEDGQLEALLDGELAPAAEATARTHLAACAECRSRLESLQADEQLLGDVLPLLDHAARPPVPLNAIVARARRRMWPLRWAAAIALLVFGTGVLYAVPGSPLRRWIDQRIGRHGTLPETPERPAAGIALVPEEGARFRIDFRAPAAGTVTIRLTDSTSIDVRRTDGIARFSAGIDRLTIETDSGPAHFAIALPRSASWVEVFAGDRRLFLKDGARTVSDVRPDSLGRYVLPLPASHTAPGRR